MLARLAIGSPVFWSPRRSALAVGLSALFLLSALCLSWTYPPPPTPLQVELVLEKGVPGSVQPLVVMGQYGAADFLLVRYVDETTVTFDYETWGFPGISSRPVGFEPGARRPLSIEMPGLSNIRGQLRPETKRLCIVYDGLTVLDQEVSSHLRASTALYFGQSPIEPSPCEPVLSGKLFRADGQELRGRMVDHLGFWDRFRGWLKPPYWQHVTLLLLSLIAAAIAHRLARVSQERLYEIVLFVRASLHRHRWFIVSAAAVWTVYAYVLFHGQAPFTYPRALCWFYDYQATSILQGRLDVPYVALPGEAYHIDGKFYGYFGITPALLRIPLLVLQIGFGNLTVPFMLAEQLGCLILAYLILCRLIARIRGPLSAPSPWAAVLLTANIGWGSNLFFLGSRGFLYHEAILCGVFFALASVYLAQRYRDDSGRRFWVGALLCGTLSVHARATVGFFALAFLGVSALERLCLPWYHTAAREEQWDEVGGAEA